MVAEKEDDRQWAFDYPLPYNSVPIKYGLDSCNTAVSYSRQRFHFQTLVSLTSLRTKAIQEQRHFPFLYFFFKSSEEGSLRGFVCLILRLLPAVKFVCIRHGPGARCSCAPHL